MGPEIAMLPAIKITVRPLKTSTLVWPMILVLASKNSHY